MPAPPVLVHALFTALKQSVDQACSALGAAHALIPLEPWVVGGEAEEMTGTVTLTGRGHLVVTAAGRQIPVLRAQVYPLVPGVLVVGRTSRADLLIDQPTVSRVHAELTYSGGSFQVADKGSYNGTMVNNRVLDPHEQVPVKDGDVIVFGEAQCVFGALSHIAQLIKHPRRNSRFG